MEFWFISYNRDLIKWNVCLPLFQGFDFELVAAKLCQEFVECLSHEKIAAILSEVAAQTGVKWIESADSFKVSGTFKQVQESRTMLKQAIHKSNEIVVLDEIALKVRYLTTGMIDRELLWAAQMSFDSVVRFKRRALYSVRFISFQQQRPS